MPAPAEPMVPVRLHEREAPSVVAARQMALPGPVDASAANASSGNGRRVRSIPKATSGHASAPAVFQSAAAGAARGQGIGRAAGQAQVR